MFCLSSSSLLIFSRSSDFMASNSNVRSLCNTHTQEFTHDVQKLKVLVCKIQHAGLLNAWMTFTMFCRSVNHLQVLLRSLHLTFVLVFDHLQAQLSVHACRKGQRGGVNTQTFVSEPDRLPILPAECFLHRPLVSVSACCSAEQPVVPCILQPSPSAPRPASPSPGSGAPETACGRTKR